MGYFETIKQTYIENWPDGLINHSISTVYFPLTPEEINALLNVNYITIEDGRNPKEDELKIVGDLIKKVDDYIAQFPQGTFVCLGSRSPKDFWQGYQKGSRCISGKYAVELLCESERVYFDLHLAMVNNYTPHLMIREWVDIKPWQEFRCFYKNKRLVGISQYNCLKREVFPEIIELADSIEWAIKIQSNIVAPLFPSEYMVVDYIYKQKKYGNKIINEVTLLEINPFTIHTNPCLFDWSKDKFDQFEFRYNGKNI